MKYIENEKYLKDLMNSIRNNGEKIGKLGE